MPVQIIELDGGLGNLIKGEGLVTGDEFYNALAEHAAKPEAQLKKYIYSISDYTEITDNDVSIPQLYKAALIMDDFANVNRNILIGIAASDPVAYNLAKLYSYVARLTGWKFGVFRKRSDLDQWLLENLAEKTQQLNLKFDKG